MHVQFQRPSMFQTDIYIYRARASKIETKQNQRPGIV